MNHIMIDLETMGNTSFSAITAIAAVRFDVLTGMTGESFFAHVDLKSCLEAGLHVDASTVTWWMEQEDDVRKAFTGRSGIPLEMALRKFSDFCRGDGYVWGNSARFDLGLLQNAHNLLKIPIPWDFRKELDCRTMNWLIPEIRINTPRKGSAHNPIDDCLFQISYVCDIYTSLNQRNK